MVYLYKYIRVSSSFSETHRFFRKVRLISNMASRSGPKSDSSTIALGTPTDEEQFSAWAITSSEWKGPLPFEAYINREKYLSNQEATKNGAIRFWILYDTAEVLEKSQQRTILASCETLKRKA